MSTAKWKFILSYSNQVTGDIVKVLRESGFGVLESETIYEELLNSQELGVGLRKDSGIDPMQLVKNLRQIGLTVDWKNEPAS